MPKLKIAFLGFMLAAVAAQGAQAMYPGPRVIVDDLTRCASVAGASALQQKHAGDMQAFNAMSQIAGMYQTAAIRKAQGVVKQPRDYVLELMKQQMPGYMARLDGQTRPAADVLKDETARCKQLEPIVADVMKTMQAEGR